MVERAVRVYPSLDKKPLDTVKEYVRLWEGWRKSDMTPDLGYPKQSAEQSDMNGGVRALPGWVIEMTLDRLIMMELRPELRRSVLWAHAIPLRAAEIERAGMAIGGFDWTPKISKYVWPSDTEKSARAAGMAKRTLYSHYNTSLHWLEARLTS